MIKILDHFRQLLNYIIQNPDAKLSDLQSIIPEAEIPQIRLDFQPTNNEEKPPFILPRDTVERQLAQIWSDILQVFPIGIQDNFFNLGGHSLLALKLMAQIEQEFGKNLPLSTLFQAQTIEKLATILRESTSSISWSPLVPIQTQGNKPPFFCLPGAGGNVIYFSNLARYLSLDRPFYGLQGVGLDGESEPYTSIEEMADNYIKYIKTVQPEGPYYLGGHSFGALVAFEITQQLKKQGDEVARLIVIDTPIPDALENNPNIERDWDNSRKLILVVALVEQLFGKDLEVSREILESLELEEQWNHIYERLQAVDFFPPGTGTQQIRGFVRVLMSDYEATYSYHPQTNYPIPISLFKASDTVSKTMAAKGFGHTLKQDIESDLLWGWGKFSSKPVEVYNLPGNHVTMIAEPHVQVLAEKLRDCLRAELTG